MPQDIFEQFAEEYDSWFEEHSDEYHAELDRVRRLFPSPDSRTIEIGAGSGRFGAPLGITIGIEPSRALGRMAHRRGMAIIRGCAEHLPIRDNSCSSVLMVTVICFLNDPAQAFREIHRILVPQGDFVIGFIEREGKVARKYVHEKGKHRFLSRARFYSVDEVTALLTGAGFHAIMVDSRAGFPVIATRKR
jgi:ubiquinone/menaquinone biosynthesis C-methylase UbiE